MVREVKSKRVPWSKRSNAGTWSSAWRTGPPEGQLSHPLSVSVAPDVSPKVPAGHGTQVDEEMAQEAQASSSMDEQFPKVPSPHELEQAREPPLLKATPDADDRDAVLRRPVDQREERHGEDVVGACLANACYDRRAIEQRHARHERAEPSRGKPCGAPTPVSPCSGSSRSNTNGSVVTGKLSAPKRRSECAMLFVFAAVGPTGTQS